MLLLNITCTYIASCLPTSLKYILNNSWVSIYTFADMLYFLRRNYQLKRVILLQNWDPKGIYIEISIFIGVGM